MHQEEEELDFEWEVRREDIPFQVHMIAGCFAGLFEHACMLPFDNVKTHSQVSSDLRMRDIVKQIYNYENRGFVNFYRGISVVASGCMPAHAVQFSVYELARNKFGINDEQIHPYLFGLTGAIATFFHDFIMTPLDVIKQRRQVSGDSITKIFRSMIKNEGPLALYRSFPITYMMNAPTMAVMVATNESLKTITQKPLVKEHNFMSYFACAGIAGMVAAILTNPLDVIKTKMQTQDIFSTQKSAGSKVAAQTTQQPGNLHTSHRYAHVSINRHKLFQSNLKYGKVKYENIKSTINVIMKEQGLSGFLRGSQARVVMFAPSSAISWAIYEQAKTYLVQNKIVH